MLLQLASMIDAGADGDGPPTPLWELRWPQNCVVGRFFRGGGVLLRRRFDARGFDVEADVGGAGFADPAISTAHRKE